MSSVEVNDGLCDVFVWEKQMNIWRPKLPPKSQKKWFYQVSICQHIFMLIPVLAVFFADNGRRRPDSLRHFDLRVYWVGVRKVVWTHAESRGNFPTADWGYNGHFLHRLSAKKPGCKLSCKREVRKCKYPQGQRRWYNCTTQLPCIA